MLSRVLTSGMAFQRSKSDRIRNERAVAAVCAVRCDTVWVDVACLRLRGAVMVTKGWPDRARNPRAARRNANEMFSYVSNGRFLDSLHPGDTKMPREESFRVQAD